MKEVIDRKALAAIRDSVPNGAAIVGRVLRTWLRDAPARLEEIHAAIDTGDAKTAHRVVHSLKSASATLGAHALATHCRSAEVSFGEGLLSRELVTQIERQYLAARAELLTILETELST